VTAHGNETRDLEQSTADESSHNVSQFGEASTKQIMLRGNRLGAFLAAAAQHFVSFVYDTIRAAKGSSKPSHNDATQSITSMLFGWPPPPVDPARETAWLDGLRGLAAFLVMTYHYHLAWYGLGLETPYGTNDDHRQLWRLPFIRILVCSGHAQVSVFFVLSGFVLSWSPLTSIRHARHDKLAQTLASATFRRWLRLFLPCFIVGIFPLLELRWGIVNLAGVDRKDTFLQQFWDYIWACEAFANPFFLERSELQAVHRYNWTMWTIPYEFAGSLVVFLLLLGVARVRQYGRRTLIVLGAAVYACLHTQWNHWLFITGILVGDYVRQAGGFEGLSRRTGPVARAAAAILFIAGLYLAGLPENMPGYKFLKEWTPANFLSIEGGARFWWCWSGIMLIISACHLVTIRCFFEFSILRYLGQISYMLYLTHRSVQESIGVFLRKRLLTAMGTEWSDEFEINLVTSSALVQGFTYIVSWLVLFPIAISVAHWCEVLVDGPCTRFARWVDDMFTKDLKPSASREEELGLLPS
jgi:peptidoglycan/LPS O-acetylase OafA/YrhL